MAYQPFTVDVPFTAITDGTSQVVATTPSANYDGSPVYVELFSPRFESNASVAQGYYIALFRDTGSSQVYLASKWCSRLLTNAGPFNELRLGFRDTPPAGAHTYSARAWSDSANGGTVRAGAGGQNNLAPGFLRVVLDL
jgi:hypothetical protein